MPELSSRSYPQSLEILDKKEILKRIKRAENVVKDAEKLLKEIRDAERRCEASTFTDLKAAAKFVKGWQKLDALRAQFSALRGSGIEFQDFAKPEPFFPDSSALMFTEADVKRKARIFGMVEGR